MDNLRKDIEMRLNFLLITVLLLNISCSMFEKPKPGIMDFLPRETDVPGWEQVKKPERIYGKQMKDTADYGKYRAVEKSYSLYRSFSEQEYVLRVELFRLNSVMDAFGMFSRERGIPGISRNVTGDYFTSDEGAFLMKGNYYIRVLANNKDDILKKQCDTFIRNIRKNLDVSGQTSELPDYLTLFSEDYTSQDVMYYRNGYSNLPGLKRVFIRNRTIGEQNKLLFFVRFNSAQSAQRKFNSLLKKNSYGYALTVRNKVPVAFKKIADNILLFFSSDREWIFGVLNSANQDEGLRITDMLRGEIKNYN